MTIEVFGWGAVVLGVVMLASEFFKWPQWLHYVWTAVVLLWGIFALI